MLCINAIQILFSFILFFTNFWLFFIFNILKLIFLSYIYLQFIFLYSLIETIDCIYFNNWFLAILFTNHHAVANMSLRVLRNLALIEFYLIAFENRLIACTDSTFRPTVILLLHIIIKLYLVFIHNFTIFIVSICSCEYISIFLIMNNAHSINRISFIQVLLWNITLIGCIDLWPLVGSYCWSTTSSF